MPRSSYHVQERLEGVRLGVCWLLQLVAKTGPSESNMRVHETRTDETTTQASPTSVTTRVSWPAAESRIQSMRALT